MVRTMARFEACGRTAIGWGMAVSALLAPAVAAQTSTTCDLVQVTEVSDGDAVGASMAAIGDHVVAMVALLDLFGPQRDLFLYDTRTGEYFETVMTVFGVGVIDLSGNDRYLTFTSREDLVPGSNPDGGFEVFRYDAASGDLAQLTDVASGDASDSAISFDGTLVAFRSNADLVSGGNADGSFEVFVLDVVSGEIAQVSDFPSGGIRTLSLSSDGSGLAYARTFPSEDLYHVDLSTLQTTLIAPSVRFVSDDALAIDPTGERVAFRSSDDLVPGQNADGNQEIFVFDAGAGTLEQITHTLTGGSTEPVFATSDHLLFVTSSELAATSGQIVSTRLSSGIFTQVMPGLRAFGLDAAPSGDRLVFLSEQNPTGGNANGGPEIFFADCPALGGATVDIPALGAAGLAVLALLLVGLALTRLPRRAA